MEDELRTKFGWKFDKVADEDLSEIHLDKYSEWSMIVENEGTLPCLEKAAAKAISEMIKPYVK